MKEQNIQDAIILFAGDSGDGMQFTGSQFSHTSALEGNDISTFPDFPAEIRAPQGTISGVSGFQLHFSSHQIYSPGDQCDVLVAMNAAAFEKNKDKVKKGGIVLMNTSGFDAKNLRLAKLEENPQDQKDTPYKIHSIDITKNTIEALKEYDLSRKQKELSKNMYALGFVYWLYNKDIEYTQKFLEQRFGKETVTYKANVEALKSGYHFGEITDTFTERYNVNKAHFPSGTYRTVSGNEALVLGLLTASLQAQKKIFFGGYPITPASDILQHLARYKKYGVQSFQAEDEIAAITSAIGASFAGQLGVTATSGPGMALKTEALGLAVMTEIPLIAINVQRGGPSTGLPTKTEQSDLMQALYGRNGEAPIPILAPQSPSHCFEVAIEASKIALEHNTPVIILSDGYCANGSEPWKIPSLKDFPSIQPNVVDEKDEEYQPYARNEKLVRQMAFPGTKGKEHVLGGLEKQNITGEVSYQPKNHSEMVQFRQKKIEYIADTFAPLSLENVSTEKEILVISWGSTYGSMKAAINKLNEEGKALNYISLKHLNPLPKDLKKHIEQHQKVFIPELNNGQLNLIIQSKYLKPVISFTKIEGLPFTTEEIYNELKKHL